MTADGSAPLYDEFYFRHGCGLPYERSPHWLAFFGQIAERITKGIAPRTVLDAGCAIGLLVEALRERGVDAYGVDISEYALAQVPETLRPFCWQGSVTDPLPRRYDVIVCIEVLEHLPRPDSERALRNLCQYTDDVLFSSSPVDLREATHFNVQPPEYWAQLFAEQGFFRDPDFDAGFILPWSVRFRRGAEPLPRQVAGYERLLWQLRHENMELRQAAVESRNRQSELEQAAAQARAESVDWHSQATEAQVLRSTRTWKVVQALIGVWRSVIPVGSRRERLLAGAVRRPSSGTSDKRSS
jgi:SAM-dependent methyltransferase